MKQGRVCDWLVSNDPAFLFISSSVYLKPDIIVFSGNVNLDGEVTLNLEGFIDQIISFGQNNPLIALIVAIIFLFSLFFRPKLTLSLLLLTLILAGIYYSMMDAASSAREEKQKLIHKSEQSSEINKQ